MKVINYFICLFFGHEKVDGLYEEKLYLYKAKCKRCNAKLGLPHLTSYNIDKNYPMPNER